MITKLAILNFMSWLINAHPNVPYKVDANILDDVSSAIPRVTSEPWEAETLARIAFWEGGLHAKVADCTILSKTGDRGVWQISARSVAERSIACSADIAVQAQLAVERVRQSKAACEKRGMRGSDLLGVYTVGRCVRGERFARLRYGDGAKLRSFLDE